MDVSDAIRVLADCVSAVERAGYDVRQVRTGDELTDGTVDSTLSVGVSPESLFGVPEGVTVAPTAAQVADDGTIAVEFDVSGTGEPRGDGPADRARTADRGAAADRTGGATTVTDGCGVSPGDPGTAVAADGQLSPVEGDDAGDSTVDGGVPSAPGDGPRRGAVAPDRRPDGDPAEPTVVDGPGSDRDPASPTGSGDRPGASADRSAGDATDAAEDAGDGGSVDDAESDADDDSETPAYRDPERLAEAYEAHDTFREMTDALGVEVTPQTVRKHAIRHGIHEPESRSSRSRVRSDRTETTSTESRGAESAKNGDDRDGDHRDGDDDADTGTAGDEPGPDDDKGSSPSDPDLVPGSTPNPSADADSESGRDVADDGASKLGAVSEDLDLPEGVSMDDLTAAVENSKTVHGVQRALDLDRERTRSLLDRVDLLTIVQRRVAEADAEVSREEIRSRIRTAAGTATCSD